MKHEDKLAHFLAGGFVAAAVLPLGDRAWAMAAVALAGLAKELLDPPPDFADLCATVVGGASMLVWLGVLA